MYEFGSLIAAKLPGKPQGGIMRVRWVRGGWLGKRWATDEHIIGLENGKGIRVRDARPENDDNAYDFHLLAEDRAWARRLVWKHKPQFLVVCPPCTLFSSLQNLSPNGLPAERCPQLWAEALMMLEFGIELCQIQRRAGRGFLFEHPLTASSWEVGAVQQLQSEKGVLTSVFEMCQFGMCAEDAHGRGLVRKSTQILTNVDEVADYLSRRCPGGHRHVHLVEGRARAAAVYPERMCEAVVKAVQLWQARQAGGPDRCQLFEFSRSDLCEPVGSKQLDDVGYL